MNFKISSKKYHYLAKQKDRDSKGKRWTRQFKIFEQNDRNDRTRYPHMPSPKGANWRDYITHRLTIMKKAIEVYTTEKYTRLRFDKYIESNRTSDKIAALLVTMCHLKKKYLTKKNLLIFCNRQMASHASFTWELRKPHLTHPFE